MIADYYRKIKYGLPIEMKDYKPLILPFSKPIDELSKEEAKQYFDWFILQADERCEYILGWISKIMDIPKSQLSYSYETIPLIEHFIKKVATKKKTSELKLLQMAETLVFDKTYIDEAKEALRKTDEYSPTTFTTYLCYDINFLIGKIIIMNNPAIRWDYFHFDNNYANNNIPCLFGFHRSRCFFLKEKRDYEMVEYISKSDFAEFDFIGVITRYAIGWFDNHDSISWWVNHILERVPSMDERTEQELINQIIDILLSSGIDTKKEILEQLGKEIEQYYMCGYIKCGYEKELIKNKVNQMITRTIGKKNLKKCNLISISDRIVECLLFGSEDEYEIAKKREQGVII